MKSKWFVLNNPGAGYIVARKRNINKIMHSGNLELYGNYSDNKSECQKLADELNRKEGEMNG